MDLITSNLTSFFRRLQGVMHSTFCNRLLLHLRDTHSRSDERFGVSHLSGGSIELISVRYTKQSAQQAY